MRKTTVKKLKTANVPESSIIKVTEHSSTKGLKSYDLGDQHEFREMSHALSAPSSLCPQQSSSYQSTSTYKQSFNVHPKTFFMVVQLISITLHRKL